MQLIYRWTKSLDPRLKKGCWTPEEDIVSAGLQATSMQHEAWPPSCQA